MVDPLVSVLIPTFNRSHYLADAVTSSLAQTLDDLEIVVVDDGSTDRTTDLLADITDARLRVLRHDHNLGIPAARNTALAAAGADILPGWTATISRDRTDRPSR